MNVLFFVLYGLWFGLVPILPIYLRSVLDIEGGKKQEDRTVRLTTTNARGLRLSLIRLLQDRDRPLDRARGIITYLNGSIEASSLEITRHSPKPLRSLRTGSELPWSNHLGQISSALVLVGQGRLGSLLRTLLRFHHSPYRGPLLIKLANQKLLVGVTSVDLRDLRVRSPLYFSSAPPLPSPGLLVTGV
ncbi:hypothetical protein F4810DRAFT_649079 [Camillea tinctor]|nr:hypothetical protein F4810DRAFT_649079 [Camillea tinctor]